MVQLTKILIQEIRNIGVDCFLVSENVLETLSTAKKQFKNLISRSGKKKEQNRILTNIFALISQHKSLIDASNHMMAKFEDFAAIQLIFAGEAENKQEPSNNKYYKNEDHWSEFLPQLDLLSQIAWEI